MQGVVVLIRLDMDTEHLPASLVHHRCGNLKQHHRPVTREQEFHHQVAREILGVSVSRVRGISISTSSLDLQYII